MVWVFAWSGIQGPCGLVPTNLPSQTELLSSPPTSLNRQHPGISSPYSTGLRSNQPVGPSSKAAPSRKPSLFPQQEGTTLLDLSCPAGSSEPSYRL